jgi:hypothetical protein
MNDSERITAVETELRNLKELIGAKWEGMHQSLDALTKAVAELQRPKGLNWTALSVCLGAIGMICAFAFVWLKTNLQPLEMSVEANKQQIINVRAECVREHQWNWDGHKQRIDTIGKQQERQEALIRMLLGERLEAYEKRVNP